MSKQEWLKAEDWNRFQELFEKVEGTNWYDVRELALMLIKNPELESKLRENKENISTILQLAYIEQNPVKETSK